MSGKAWSAGLLAWLVVLSAVLLVLTSGAAASFSGRNGKLLLTLNPAGAPEQLWLSGPGGQQERRIHNGLPCALDGDAWFMRSGTEILFPASSACGRAPVQILLLKLNGAVQKQVATVSGQGSFALSPDGRRLAYGVHVFSPRGVVHRLVFIDLRTGRTTPATSPQGPGLTGPTSWSPRGQLFYILDGDVEVTRSNGLHPRTIPIRFPGPASAGPIVQEAFASPDGSELALGVVGDQGQCDKTGSPPCRYDLYVVNARGGKARRLTRSGQASSPVWSPDGRQIAFHNGVTNAILTVRTEHVRALVERRIPAGGLGVVDWQALR